MTALVGKLLTSQRIDIVPSSDGLRFVTPQRLQDEILSLLQTIGGRASLSELQAELDVDISNVEKTAKALLSSSNGQSSASAASSASGLQQLPSGDLITSLYFDGIAAAVRDSLATDGAVTVGALAERLQLPTDVLSSALAERIASGLLKGVEMRAGVVYTDAYVARQARMTSAALSGLTRPTPLQSVVSGMEALLAEAAKEAAALAAASALSISTGPQLDGRLIDDAIKRASDDVSSAASALPGALKGRTFVPDAYGAAQRRAAESFFSGNGYLPLSRAAKLGIPDPLPLLKKTHPEALRLPSAIALPSVLLAGPGAVLEEAATSKSWACASSLFPADLGPADISVLLYGGGVNGDVIGGGAADAGKKKKVEASSDDAAASAGANLLAAVGLPVSISPAAKWPADFKSFATSGAPAVNNSTLYRLSDDFLVSAGLLNDYAAHCEAQAASKLQAAISQAKAIVDQHSADAALDAEGRKILPPASAKAMSVALKPLSKTLLPPTPAEMRSVLIRRYGGDGRTNPSGEALEDHSALIDGVVALTSPAVKDAYTAAAGQLSAAIAVLTGFETGSASGAAASKAAVASVAGAGITSSSSSVIQCDASSPVVAPSLRASASVLNQLISNAGLKRRVCLALEARITRAAQELELAVRSADYLALTQPPAAAGATSAEAVLAVDASAVDTAVSCVVREALTRQGSQLTSACLLYCTLSTDPSLLPSPVADRCLSVVVAECAAAAKGSSSSPPPAATAEGNGEHSSSGNNLVLTSTEQHSLIKALHASLSLPPPGHAFEKHVQGVAAAASASAAAASSISSSGKGGKSSAAAAGSGKGGGKGGKGGGRRGRTGSDDDGSDGDAPNATAASSSASTAAADDVAKLRSLGALLAAAFVPPYPSPPSSSGKKDPLTSSALTSLSSAVPSWAAIWGAHCPPLDRKAERSLLHGLKSAATAAAKAAYSAIAAESPAPSAADADAGSPAGGSALTAGSALQTLLLLLCAAFHDAAKLPLFAPSVADAGSSAGHDCLRAEMSALVRVAALRLEPSHHSRGHVGGSSEAAAAAAPAQGLASAIASLLAPLLGPACNGDVQSWASSELPEQEAVRARLREVAAACGVAKG